MSRTWSHKIHVIHTTYKLFNQVRGRPTVELLTWLTWDDVLIISGTSLNTLVKVQFNL